jgi:hypothetical protein
MKVKVTEMFDFPANIIFAVLTDIPHHTDWLKEPVELVSLIGGPAKPGTKWEQNSNPFGKKLVTINTCNLYERNRKFGWITEKPFLAQVTFLLEPDEDRTKLTWMVESDEAGIVQLAGPLLNKQTNEMIQKSLIGLKTYLQNQA